MKNLFQPVALAILAVLLGGCVTEPAPDEPKVHGHIGPEMKKAKKAKPVKETKEVPVGGPAVSGEPG